MQRSVTPLVKPRNFMHPDDSLILEDESGRVKLGGSALSPAVYVTGIIVSLFFAVFVMMFERKWIVMN